MKQSILNDASQYTSLGKWDTTNCCQLLYNFRI